MNQERDKEFYTPEELADRLMVYRQTITGWLRDGLIRGVRAGRHWRIPREEFKRVLREGVNTSERKKK